MPQSNINFCQFAMKMIKLPATMRFINALPRNIIDKSLILYCIWHSQSGFGRLSLKELKALQQTSENIRQSVVGNLLQLNAKIAHLHSEKIHNEADELVEFAYETELQMVANTINTQLRKNRKYLQLLEDTCHNLAKYIRLNQNRCQANLIDELIDFIQACFLNESPNRIKEILLLACKKEKIMISSAEQLSIL
jgi:hypothetical protein